MPSNNETIFFSLGTSKGTSVADGFLKARPGSVLEKVFKNNMNLEESFPGTKIGLNYTSQRDDYAFYQDKQIVLAKKEYHCKAKSTDAQTGTRLASFDLTFHILGGVCLGIPSPNAVFVNRLTKAFALFESHVQGTCKNARNWKVAKNV